MPFDPYYSWLGIPPHEQPPNHYRLLGLSLFEQNEEAICNAADRQMAHVHSFQSGPHSADSQRLLNELALARNCLLDLEQRRSYDAHLRLRFSRSLSAVAALPVEIPTEGAAAEIPLCVTGNVSYELAPASGPIAVGALTSLEGERPDSARTSAGFAHIAPTVRTRATTWSGRASHSLQIVGGGAAGIVLSLLVMHYVLGIDVQQLFSLPERPPPIAVKKPDEVGKKQTAPVDPRVERPAQVVTKARQESRPRQSRPAPSKLPPLPIPDLATERGSLQGQIRAPRLYTPTESELQEVRGTADAILASARQDAKSAPYAIAQQLVQQARGRDPALRYTLLMWAAEAARAAGKFQLMCDVVDELAREQAVSALSTKAKLLVEGEPAISTPDEASAFVDAAAVVIDEALLRFDHPTAYDVAVAVVSLRERVVDPSLRDKCDQIRKKVEQRTGITTTSPNPPDPPFTGLFHKNGERGEAFTDENHDISDIAKYDLETITGWGKKANNGKTAAERYLAMDVMMRIAINYKDGSSRLTDTELAEMETQVVALAKSKDSTAQRIAASIATTLGKRDWLFPQAK